MRYEFRTDDGRVLIMSMPGKDAPAIGSINEIPDPQAGGKLVAATRIMSVPSIRGDNWRPYVSSRLPRNLAGCNCTPSGKPIIESRSQERNIMARHGYERE